MISTWSKLHGENWSSLLSYQPQFSEFCDWNKLSGRDWVLLIKHQPKLLK